MQAVETATAHWLSRDTIGWLGAEPSGTYRLYYSLPGEVRAETSNFATGDLFVPLSADRNGLPEVIVEKRPFLRGATALKIAQEDLSRVPALLKGGLVVTKIDGVKIVGSTALQIAGVLDDLFRWRIGRTTDRTGSPIPFMGSHRQVGSAFCLRSPS
jgi:hypothetical protein